MGGNPAPDWATGPSATSRASSSSAGTRPEESPSSSGRRPGTPPAMPGTVSRAPGPDPLTRFATVTDGEARSTHNSQETTMRKTVWLAAFAVLLCTAAMATERVAVLDGTSWKVDVEPDNMAQSKGEKQFKETLTFADGNITVSAPKVGFEATPYSVTKAGEKDFTFKAERTS